MFKKHKKIIFVAIIALVSAGLGYTAGTALNNSNKSQVSSLNQQHSAIDNAKDNAKKASKPAKSGLAKYESSGFLTLYGTIKTVDKSGFVLTTAENNQVLIVTDRTTRFRNSTINKSSLPKDPENIKVGQQIQVGIKVQDGGQFLASTITHLAKTNR